MSITLKGNMVTLPSLIEPLIVGPAPGKDVSFVIMFQLRYEELHAMEKQVKLQVEKIGELIGDETNCTIVTHTIHFNGIFTYIYHCNPLYTLKMKHM